MKLGLVVVEKERERESQKKKKKKNDEEIQVEKLFGHLLKLLKVIRLAKLSAIQHIYTSIKQVFAFVCQWNV